MGKVSQYWILNKSNEECSICKLRVANVKVLVKNEYGVSYITYLCSTCFAKIYNKVNLEEVKRQVIEELIKRIKQQKRNKKRYNIIDLLPSVAYQSENIAFFLVKMIEYFESIGIRVIEGKGRSRGHFQIIIERDKDLTILEEALKRLQ